MLALRTGATYDGQVNGATHQFYRYPARFSPQFARAAIHAFSKPGELVLDPFMGGGTAIVESLLAGRRCIGNDLNSLAVFLARVKTTPLTALEALSVEAWARTHVPKLSYTQAHDSPIASGNEGQLRNLSIPRARPIKKIISLALSSLDALGTNTARDFCRCAILNAGQWALNGRRIPVTAGEFRTYLSAKTLEMLSALSAYAAALPPDHLPARLIHGPAAEVRNTLRLGSSEWADIVVTSPPYPGIHLLYHRWQVDGRKESPAPYWIAGCRDGKGAAYYNIADRRDQSSIAYFEGIQAAFSDLRPALKAGAFVVQLLAFARPRSHLPRYLSAMIEAGYEEVRDGKRIWRRVPRRKWHASTMGATTSSREVVLVHRAT